jgi:hypothetical protein
MYCTTVVLSDLLDVNIPFTQHLKSHLSWWKNGANTLKGLHFQQTKTNITITTDASKLGYRGFMGDSIFLFSLLLVSLCPNPGEIFPLNMLFSDLELDMIFDCLL